MPLIKNGSAPTMAPGSPSPTGEALPMAQASTSPTNAAILPTKKAGLGGTHKAGDRAKAPLTKEGYWDRKEERDIQRDKDMAWSGLAQAALGSVGVIQLNAENTEDGLVSLVVRITDKLLKARDSR